MQTFAAVIWTFVMLTTFGALLMSLLPDTYLIPSQRSRRPERRTLALITPVLVSLVRLHARSEAHPGN